MIDKRKSIPRGWRQQLAVRKGMKAKGFKMRDSQHVRTDLRAPVSLAPITFKDDPK